MDQIFLRLLFLIYTNQKCNVKWCAKGSESYKVKNGVRQGAVSSGILFAIYINEILTLLRKSGLGCHTNGVFYGALFYADGILLLYASRSGLQEMVNICHMAASVQNLSFGTNVNPSKSKIKCICIVFSKKWIALNDLKNMTLNGYELPWVQSLNHLGLILQANSSMKIDMSKKNRKIASKL